MIYKALQVVHVISILLFIIGLIMVFVAFSTDDYVTMVMRQPAESVDTFRIAATGILLMLPYPIMFGD